MLRSPVRDVIEILGEVMIAGDEGQQTKVNKPRSTYDASRGVGGMARAAISFDVCKRRGDAGGMTAGSLEPGLQAARVRGRK